MRLFFIFALALAGYSAFDEWRARSRRPTVPAYVAPDRALVRDEVRLEMRRQMSLAVARERYPDLSIAGSALLEAVQAREEALRDSGDTILDDPEYPLLLVEEEAARLGLFPLP